NQQLPAVAVRVLGVRLRRRALAGLLARGVPPLPGRVRDARTALRRPLVATPRGRRAQRHNQRSDLAARVLVALPAATLAIVFAVLLGTFLGDTGAYLGGRAFGRTKLAPTISPNKTVEGLLCGMATAVVAVWWAGLSQDWLGGTKGALLGLGVAIAAPLGDL